MNVKKYYEVFKTCLSLVFQERMMYKWEFIILQFNFVVFRLGQPIFFLIIYAVTDGFPGWSLAEVLLLSGYIAVVDGLVNMFSSGIAWGALRRVRKGTFDIILLKPVNAMAYLPMRHFNTTGVGRLLAGILVTSYSYYLDPLTFGEIGFLFLYIPVAAAVFHGLIALISAAIIRFIDLGRLMDLNGTFRDYASYPSSIYPSGIRWLFFSAIPLLAVAVLPVSIIKGTLTPIQLISIPAAILWGVLGTWVWNKTLKHYTSAGG